MKERYYSLDVFRGATVALMILVNNPGNWDSIFAPLDHAPWHGCTPTDLVFPFFLFAVGNALSFVVPSWANLSTKQVLLKIGKRTLLIFCIGVFLNWCPFYKWDGVMLLPKPWSTVRIMGVLQRIALCYGIAAWVVYRFTSKNTFLLCMVLLLGYWFVSFSLGQAGDPYSLQGYFGTAIDQSILGSNHLYKGEGVPFDPEGIASLPAAIVQVILGFFVGQLIQQNGKTHQMLSKLLIIGCVLVFTGSMWDYVYPITKKTWTSSYTIYTSGLAIIGLAILIYNLEFSNQTYLWSKFFDVFGKNPLFIFVLSGFLPRVLALFRWIDHLDESNHPVFTSPLNWFYLHVCKNIAADLRIGSLVYALVMIAFYWGIVYFLDKKRIYIKV